MVYIAPLKALVRERITDWKVRIEEKLGKSVVELTGDVSPDVRAIAGASVIVTTPEKWDGISRSWQTRNYVQKVALIIIDEIHLLGEDRGPVLEVIVSRTNFIASHTSKALRIVGLSTALANAVDLANWLGIEQVKLHGDLASFVSKFKTFFTDGTLQFPTLGSTSAARSPYQRLPRQALLPPNGNDEPANLPSD